MDNSLVLHDLGSAQPGMTFSPPPPSDSGSAELVRRIQAGGAAAGATEAEAELSLRYREKLLFLLRRWTRDSGTAEDLCQETLRLALEKVRAGELRDPEQLGAFLRSLAKNLSIQLYRRAGEQPERRQELDRIPEPADLGAGPLARLLQEEKAQLARRVLQDLGSERDRQILLRYYIAEEPSDRICSDLGLTSDHFYRVLHRARGRYRRLFEERLERTAEPCA